MPKLTKHFIESEIQQPSSGQRFYRDEDLPGFAVRVTQASKSYVLEKRIDGCSRRITIGKCSEMSLDTARQQACVTKRYDKAQTPCQRLIHLVTSETIKLQLHQTFMSLNPVQLLADIENLQLRLDAATKKMLNIPESTQVLESEKLMIKAKSKTEKKMEQPSKVKTGRKSIVPDEVTRVISFLMHQDPSMTSTGLLPLLNQRYPGMYGNKQWATLARQIKKWRALHPEYQRFYPKCQRKYVDPKTTANIA